MEATRVIAIRHGETAWNVDTRIQGQLDVTLNARGRWQAQRVAAAVAHEPIAAVYASDLERAQATAAPLAAAAGVPVQPERGLRERAFGIFEGLTFAEIEARWPDDTRRWRQRDPAFGPEGGETLRDFYGRVVATASALAARHAGQTIVLVAHGGVMDCLYRAGTRVDLAAPRSWLLANAGVNRLLHSAEGFVLLGWGDTRHLDDEARDEVEAGA